MTEQTFSVTTEVFDAVRPQPFMRQLNKKMEFKAAAAYAAAVIANPKNFRVLPDGAIEWHWEHTPEVQNFGHTMIQMNRFGKVSYNRMIDGTDEYPAIMYICKAMNNAITEVRESVRRN